MTMQIRRVAGMVVLLTGLSPSMASGEPDRFVQDEPVTGEVVVTDTVTHLVWTLSFATGKTWVQALAHCEDLDYGGHTDWRLPNRQELMSLVNYQRYSPASDFPEMPSEWFWSSSSHAYRTLFAWRVSFLSGIVTSGGKSVSYRARCVRGGP
jgi:hypothetical protein